MQAQSISEWYRYSAAPNKQKRLLLVQCKALLQITFENHHLLLALTLAGAHLYPASRSDWPLPHGKCPR